MEKQRLDSIFSKRSIPKPDAKKSEHYKKAFENINKSLRETVEGYSAKERSRVQETSIKADSYMLS